MDPSTRLFETLGASGLRAGDAAYERVADGLSRLFADHAPAGAQRFRLPPVMRRSEVERSGYARSFPHLLAVAEPLTPGAAAEASIGEALVLTPAACYPVYPALARLGSVPSSGTVVDVQCDCFRCEASFDIARLRSFRMREFVFVGGAKEAQTFRNRQIEIGETIAKSLGLDYEVTPANDPFFGPGASFLKAHQRSERLKYELLIPVMPDSPPTACASFNLHLSHFGDVWGLTTSEGEVAHSACVAFGTDRFVVALYARHGPEPASWPAALTGLLRL